MKKHGEVDRARHVISPEWNMRQNGNFEIKSRFKRISGHTLVNHSWNELMVVES